MARYIIDVDITMSKRIPVDAKNEEQAKEIFEGIMSENPYSFATTIGAYVHHNITDVYED